MSAARRALASAATQLWHGGVRLVLLLVTAVQLVVGELARLLLRLRLRLRLRYSGMSLPNASPSSGSSSTSSSWGARWRHMLTSGPRSARRQSHAALELLEKFRQGPETHSEWNLFLWRATFPLVSLVLLTLLCVLGQFGHTLYSLLVCPVWYFCNLALVAAPFLLVFRFRALEDDTAQTRLWRALGAVSLGISLVEWYMSAPASRYSWVVGNTLFGIVALGALPMFFRLQSRTARSQYDALVGEQEQQQARSHSEDQEDVLTGSTMPLQSDGGFAVDPSGRGAMPLHQMDVYSPRASAPSSRSGSFVPDDNSLSTAPLSLGARQRSTGARSGSDGFNSSSLRRGRNQQFGTQQGQPASRLLYGCAACAVVFWLVMFSSYSAARGAEASTRSWFLLNLLSPVLCVVLFCVRSARVRFSFDHAVAYGVLVVHIPLFLGQLCVRLFALAEDPSGPEGAATSSESWLKLGISVLYLLLMQGYFFVITHTVNSMSEPFAHPSLLYVGQLYYYTFWYILVGSDTPIDALYWGMLLVNNVHIAFLNTGVYTDFKRSSSAWLTVPLQANVTSSVALCLRSTTSAMTAPSCFHQASVRRGVLGCGVAGPAAVMETDAGQLEGGNCDCEYLSDGEGFTSLREASKGEDDMSSTWRSSIGSSFRGRELSVSSSSRRDATPTTVEDSLPHKAARSSTLGDKCSRVQTSCTKCGASSARSKVTPAVGTSLATTPTSETLRPLYFLMKLAEQDNMADTTALILVPSLLTLLAVFEKPGHALAVLQEQTNLWLRCVCMFVGRLGGAFLAREIFACKLRSRLRSSPDSDHQADNPDGMSGSIDGLPPRLWIQRLMLQDFHAQFWYLTAVTMVVTFACFDRVDLPLRFALLS